MTEIAINRGIYRTAVLKWTGLFIFLTLCLSSLHSFHQHHMQTLKIESERLNQKSYLVKQLHNEMLLITRAQLNLLHASNHTQVKHTLSELSTLISNHLVHYYELKNIADDSDTELLMKFKAGFEKWQLFNEDLLSYANRVSDSEFINTLNKVDMAISQLDENETLLLISQLKEKDRVERSN